MSQRTFRFKLRSSHCPPERGTRDLVVEFLSDSGLWEPQQLSFTLPGFRIDLISLLLCQHVYLVANAHEKGIALQEVQADFNVTTSSEWIIEHVQGDFRIRIERNTNASNEVMAYMQERMKLCPISKNLPESVGKTITVTPLASGTRPSAHA
jgi:hypothetical protein